MRSPVWDGDWRITQDWGPTDLAVEPRYEGGHWHCGVDIGMPVGTPLYAARSGLVTHRTLGILGIAVAGKETDYYIHGSYPVLLGAVLKAGQSIGLSGNIQPGGGYTTGPHLHYERQRPGGFLNEPSTSLDPLPILDPQTYSGGGGTITPDDMTGDQDSKLTAIYDFISNPDYAHFHLGFRELKAILAELKVAILALPPGGAPADNAAVLTAIAKVQLVVDKIDRGD